MTSEIALSKLDEEELRAYKRHQASGKSGLSAQTSLQFFQLFLQGHSTKEIVRLNPGFDLGLVVQARLDYKWDEHRDSHFQALLSNVSRIVQQTQIEAIRFVADGMAAFQKLAGEKFQKYIQTGDENALGDLKHMGIKQYKDLQEMFQKLTGQGENKSVSGEVLHRHIAESQEKIVDSIGTNKPYTANEASELLKMLGDSKNEE